MLITLEYQWCLIIRVANMKLFTSYQQVLNTFLFKFLVTESD